MQKIKQLRSPYQEVRTSQTETGQTYNNIHKKCTRKDLKLYFQILCIISILFAIGVILYQRGHSSTCKLTSLPNSNIKYEKQKIRKINTQTFKPYKRTTNRLQNKQKEFLKQQKFQINLSQILNKTSNIWRSTIQMKKSDDLIYQLTNQDLNQVIRSEKIDFQLLKSDIMDSLAYEIIEFEPLSTLDLPKILQFSYFNSQLEISQYLLSLVNADNAAKYIQKQKQKIKQKVYKSEEQKIQQLKIIEQDSKNIDLQLAIQIGKQFYTNTSNQKLLEAEYFQANKKYQIENNSKQKGICIYTGTHNLVKRNQYKQYLDAFQKINYTNYRIIYVDDASTDNTTQQIYNYVNQNNYRFRNRMKIVHNFQNVGNMANLVLWTEKLCQEDDIVAIVDGDDSILGTQTFKILNSIYNQDSNKGPYYVYSQYIQILPQKQIQKGLFFTGLSVKTSQMRRSKLHQVPHLRTFRMKLLKSVPLYQFIQYHYDSNTGVAWPFFPFFSADYYQIYSLFQLAGEKNTLHLNESYFYLYYGPALTSRRCYQLREEYDQMKNILKTPLKQVNFQRGVATQEDNDIPPQDVFQYTTYLAQQALSCQCYIQ